MAEVITVIGGQWGDEGKGKIVSNFAERANLVVRATGGGNAGHTVVTDQGEFKLHLIPSGILGNKKNLIGQGVSFDLDGFMNEARELELRGVYLDGLMISDKATVLMPHHKTLDRLQERLKKEKVETTGQGIGPACADRDYRTALLVGDLKDPDRFMDLLDTNLYQMRRFYNLCDLSEEEMKTFYAGSYRGLVDSFAGRYINNIVDAQKVIFEHLKNDSVIVGEGAQATLLDTYAGTYPYVTGSPCTTSGFLYAAGLPPRGYKLTNVGVYKAYMSRVGNGPFPTEFSGEDEEIGNEIREKGHEYGTTTGRPRRVGAFDLVLANYTAKINGFDKIALTRIDTLSGQQKLAIAWAYQIDGEVTKDFPSSVTQLMKAKPFYKDFDGWDDGVSKVRNRRDLPDSARKYIECIEDSLRVPVSYIGVGPHRDALICV